MLFRSIFIIIFSVFLFANCFTQSDSAKKADSLLLLQLQAQMKTETTPAPQVRTSPSANPNISVIGDFQGMYHNWGKRNYDAGLNEAEFAFQSEVDPYARADFFASFGKNASGDFSADIEEAFLTTLALPKGLQLKVGKFKSALGRINPVHSHALPFISLPNAYENYFGEGINDEGLSLSWLLPNKLFYQELVVQGTAGPKDCPSFSRSNKNMFLSLAHLKNFWDLSSSTTLEFGFTGITGPNDSSFTTNIGAADLTLKWKPLRYNTYKSVTFQNEFYYSQAALMKDTGTANTMGMYSMLSFQFSKRWFFTGMYSYSNMPYSADIIQQAYSATVAWYATEFQKIEIEGKTVTSNMSKQSYQAMLRWIFVIGSHGAHQY